MASEQHAGDLPLDPAARTAVGRAGRHHRPSALRAAVHERLEEMRFRHGVLLMVTAGVLFVALVGGVVWALSGGSDARSPRGGLPPAAEPTSASASPTGHSHRPRSSSRRPKTSSSTMVGTTSPRPTPRPAGSAKPTGLPSWWPTGGSHRHHGSPPPWWHRH